MASFNRSRFADELARNPTLREKMLAIAAGENLHPDANVAVFETMLNRADMMGTPLAFETRTTGEGGYYAGYNPKALQNPQTRALLEANLQRALEGSNVSNFATDNSSEGNNRFSSRRFSSGMYTPAFSAGGEYFSYPSNSMARGFNRYADWRTRVEGEGDSEPSGSMMANRLKQRVQQVAASIDGQPASGPQYAQASTGTMTDARPVSDPNTLPMPPDEARAKMADALITEANQVRPRTGLELLGGLAQYGVGMYNKGGYNTENREYRTKLRDAMLGAVKSGDRQQILNVMAANPETANAALTAVLASTGPKAQDWQALPAQTDAYGRPLPARVMNKHTGEIRTVGGETQQQPAQQAPSSIDETPSAPGTAPPQASGQTPASTQVSIKYGQAVPKPPEGYIHASDENGFIYENGQPKFILKADADTSARKREINMAEMRTNAQGAADFLRGLNRARDKIAAAPDWTFGPIAASEVNQTFNRTFGTHPEKQKVRDEISPALRDLELSVAQMKLKGQGQVTEAERKIAKETLPSLDRDKSVQLSTLADIEKDAIAKIRRAIAEGVDVPQDARDYLAAYDEEQKAVKDGGGTGALDANAPSLPFTQQTTEAVKQGGRGGGGFPDSKPIPQDAVALLQSEIAKGNPGVEAQFIEHFGQRGQQLIEQMRQGQQPEVSQTAAPRAPSPDAAPLPAPKPKLRYNPQTGELEQAQ